MIERILLFISLGGLASSTIYLFLALIAAIRFRGTSPAIACLSDGDLPPVTVLMPLCGMEPLMQQRLESFFRQDYPSFELIFGARNTSDPVLKIVEALQQKHPQVRAAIVLSGKPAYPNAKVHGLEKMIAAASFPYLVITDSDVRVGPDFVRQWSARSATRAWAWLRVSIGVCLPGAFGPGWKRWACLWKCRRECW